MRSVAAMAAGPFIEYYQHTLDPKFLREYAYPFVSEVARFYASYLTWDPTSSSVSLRYLHRFC